MPPKLYQAPTEYDLAEMPEHDRKANRELADGIFRNVMGGKAGRTLDIGAKHPVLASALAALGCEAHAIDGVMPSAEPGVTRYEQDFETMRTVQKFTMISSGNESVNSLWEPFRLITMIHMFEHVYDPLAALRKLRALVEDDGRVFLRLPDHNVPGFERDLTAQHYSIHGYFHCLTSILECLKQTENTFVIERTYPMTPGQRDIVLRPL